jgi:hypothetical protein
MKLALIPPISLLEYTDETACQLMLPQLIDDVQYEHVYKTHCDDPNQYVILDNGLAENQQVDGGALLRIADLYGVDEVVIPDVYKDCDETIISAKLFGAHQTPSARTFNFQFVAQGKTTGEFFRCANWAADQEWIDVIAIPRHMCETGDDNRYALAVYLEKIGCEKPVHLLGGAPAVPDEIDLYDWPENVRSHDTSSPFNFAYACKGLDDGTCVKRPDDYFNLPSGDFPSDITEYNVMKLMEWTGNDL